MSRRNIAYISLPLAAVAVAFASPSVAAHRPFQTVTACSTWGNFGCETAQVRRSRLGFEYRTKNGSWVDCASDCFDTLRRATVDFWEDQRETAR